MAQEKKFNLRKRRIDHMAFLGSAENATVMKKDISLHGEREGGLVAADKEAQVAIKENSRFVFSPTNQENTLPFDNESRGTKLLSGSCLQNYTSISAFLITLTYKRFINTTGNFTYLYVIAPLLRNSHFFSG